jgi:hypothetical protein
VGATPSHPVAADPLEPHRRTCPTGHRPQYPAMQRALFLLLLLLAPGTLRAEAAPTRLIGADLSQARGPTSRMYNFCVGAGRAN